jgi:AhpD family alkylhydroperoxidase
MDDRTRELEAVAAAMASGCPDCLQQHVAAARRLGVNSDQLREAVTIGRTVPLRAKLGMDGVARALLGEGELALVSAEGGCGPDCSAM